VSYYTHKHTGDTVLEIGRAHDCTPGRRTTEQVMFMRADDPKSIFTIDADCWATVYAPEVPA
jgi:hypothetical protein